MKRKTKSGLVMVLFGVGMLVLLGVTFALSVATSVAKLDSDEEIARVKAICTELMAKDEKLARVVGDFGEPRRMNSNFDPSGFDPSAGGLAFEMKRSYFVEGDKGAAFFVAWFESGREGWSYKAHEVFTPEEGTTNPEHLQVLFSTAYDLLDERRCEEAAMMFANCFNGGFLPGLSAYNAACAWAGTEEKEKALDWLEVAIKNGFDDAGHINWDRDLDSIRELERFKEILGRLET